MVDGQEFIAGEISLDANPDTALLKPFGFRNLEFHGRGFRCVKYGAIWPRDVALDYQPTQLTGIY